MADSSVIMVSVLWVGLPSWANINCITLVTARACSEVIRYGVFALKEASGTAPYFATWLRCGTCYI
jgi:hypothetical protein